MRALSWREVDFAGVVISGLVSGYVMAIAGLWTGRVPGLVTMDIADFGRRYMGSDSPTSWLFGLSSHLINSILLTWLWAAVLLPNFLTSWPRVLHGALWGEILALTLSGALVAPMAGLGLMGRKTGDFRLGVTSALMHGLWGAMIGILYVPPS